MKHTIKVGFDPEDHELLLVAAEGGSVAEFVRKATLDRISKSRARLAKKAAPDALEAEILRVIGKVRPDLFRSSGEGAGEANRAG